MGRLEPNGDLLWARLREEVRMFLRVQWRAGALMGRTEDQAFIIVCDNSTMTQADIQSGRVLRDRCCNGAARRILHLPDHASDSGMMIPSGLFEQPSIDDEAPASCSDWDGRYAYRYLGPYSSVETGRSSSGTSLIAPSA